VAAVRYGLNGLYELTSSAGVQTASGYIGLAIFAATLYGGLAFGIEDVQHRTVLPLGCRGEAAEAFEGDLSQQVSPIESEAGRCPQAALGVPALLTTEREQAMRPHPR
jgi:uncharacterized protein